MKTDDTLTGNSRTRTLQRAAESLGGTPVLADHLNVPLAELESWLASTHPMPHEIFSRALDIVAAGPFRMLGTGDAHRSALEAKRAQAHAHRLQMVADRMHENAERAQAIADRAQHEADVACDRADIARIIEDSRRLAPESGTGADS